MRKSKRDSESDLRVGGTLLVPLIAKSGIASSQPSECSETAGTA